MFNKIPFFIKLFNKEYWPMWLTYLPVIPYYFFLSAKARSFFFFTAANPSIETGGMLGESKISILDKIDEAYKPKSLFIAKSTPFETVLATMKKENLAFPIVAKPNIGQRGNLVEKIMDESQLNAHFAKNKIDYILQPFVAYKEEYAVLYYRFPNEKRGKITSITRKKFLTVVGDGHSTIKELIWQQSRAILQWKRLEAELGEKLETILANDEEIQLEPIGNHCRGTMFLNDNHHIDEQLERVFDRIMNGMEDVYFGRFDLKCESMAAMKAGRHIAVLEFNGVGAEPAHIYDPSYPLWKTWRDVLNQWTIVYKISRMVHRQQKVPYMTIGEMWTYWRNLVAYNESLNK